MKTNLLSNCVEFKNEWNFYPQSPSTPSLRVQEQLYGLPL